MLTDVLNPYGIHTHTHTQTNAYRYIDRSIQLQTTKCMPLYNPFLHCMCNTTESGENDELPRLAYEKH